MSVQESEAAVVQLPSPELARLQLVFEEYQAGLWDQQIERDALSGRLDALADEANQEFEAGRCRHGLKPEAQKCPPSKGRKTSYECPM